MELTTKVFNFLTLIFLAYNLLMLWEESSTINYRFINETKFLEGEKIKFTLCIPISELGEGKSKELPEYKPTNYSESNFNVADYLRETVRLLNEELRRVHGSNDVIELEQSYVFNKHACLRIAPKHLAILNSFADYTYKLYGQVEDYRLIFSDFFYSNVRRRNTVTLIKIYKLTIMNNRLPNANLNKFNCMNRCLKARSRKPAYLYEFNDTEPIDLSVDNFLEVRDLEGAKACDQKCNEKSPLMVYILAIIEITFRKEYLGNVTTAFQIANVFYETYDAYTTVDLLLQAAGLITLFINMNLNQTLPALFKLAFNSYLRTALFWRVYPKLRFLLLVVSFIVVFETALGMFNKYRRDIDFPIETKISNYSLSPTPFAMAFCIPVKVLLFLNANFSGTVSDLSDDRILSSYSYDEIEQHTDVDLDEFIEESYLSFGNRKIPRHLKALKKIFFKNCSYENPFTNVVSYNFSRCFKVYIDLVEHRYQSLLAISKFAVEFKPRTIYDNEPLLVAVYLLEGREIFSSNTFELKGDYLVLAKRSVKSRNSLTYNCYDYPTSKASSIDECINETFLKRHNNLSAFSLLDKDQFPAYFYTRRYFNTTIDEKIIKECRNKSLRIDCRLTLFRPSYNKIKSTHEKREVNLYFEMIEYLETEQSWQKLALSCSNLASIFFSTNARKALLTASFVIIRLVLRLKWRKWFKHIIFFLCFLGFLLHCKNIFENIINSDLSQDAYYRKNETIQFPDLVLCVQDFVNEKLKEEVLDKNHKLTGNYLSLKVSFVCFIF